MRREQHGTHAAHREEEHHAPHTRDDVEPRKRSYERIVDGEKPFPDDLPEEAPATEEEPAEPSQP